MFLLSLLAKSEIISYLPHSAAPGHPTYKILQATKDKLNYIKNNQYQIAILISGEEIYIPLLLSVPFICLA